MATGKVGNVDCFYEYITGAVGADIINSVETRRVNLFTGGVL